MSWMDSWSRPGKHAATPPPLYLTQGEHVVYCQTCGRVINSRKSQQKQKQGVKYCSDRCRRRKPGELDTRIENAIVALLNGESGSGIEKTACQSRYHKGDRRNVVTCGEIEEIVFGSRHDPTRTFGRKKNRASRALPSDDDENVTSMAESDESSTEDETALLKQGNGGVRLYPPQFESEVNGSVDREDGEAASQLNTPGKAKKMHDGQRRAAERERVRRAARRGVVFGFLVQDVRLPTGGRQKGKQRLEKANNSESAESTVGFRRKCEALMNGSVVEPSFAKGDWSIRWREGE